MADIETLPELLGILDQAQHLPPFIRDYERNRPGKLQVAAELLERVPDGVAGRRVLDIGPGAGDFLDLVRERGGTAVGFDYDPVVVQWLRMRGHVALRGNLLRSLRALQGQRFDLINSSGSIVVEYFNVVGLWALRRLLRDLESHLAPGGTLLIIPYFEPVARGGPRKTADPLRCPFSEILRAAGYDVVSQGTESGPSSTLPLLFQRRKPGTLPQCIPGRERPVLARAVDWPAAGVLPPLHEAEAGTPANHAPAAT